MNGYWYHWGYQHTSPAVFVAAWRHIVTLFRQQGADDVTWLWTTNIIDAKGGIPDPAPWWPGEQYVTWIGIDGYYYRPSWTFASLFGPTIKAVRALTRSRCRSSSPRPGRPSAAGQPAKIADLTAGDPGLRAARLRLVRRRRGQGLAAARAGGAGRVPRGRRASTAGPRHDPGQAGGAEARPPQVQAPDQADPSALTPR